MNDDDDAKAGKRRLENWQWTKQDGSTFHKQMRDEAWERYEFAESKINVEAEQELGLLDPDGNYAGYGYADLVIEDKHVIDYKTDQMDTWTESTARARGQLYGSKVAAYTNSPQLREDAEGHLLMVGHRSDHEHINEIFRHAAAEHGVSVTFCESADPKAVMDEIEERFMSVDRSVEVPVEAEIPLTEMVDASPSTQPIENFYGRRQFDLVKGMVKVDEAATVAFGETFAEVVQPDPGFHAPDQSTHAPEGDFTTALFVGIQIGFNHVKDTRLGQYVAEQYESFQEWRLARQIEVVPRETSTEIAELTAAHAETVEVQAEAESQAIATEEVASEEIAAEQVESNRMEGQEMASEQIAPEESTASALNESADTSREVPSEPEEVHKQVCDPMERIDPESVVTARSEVPGVNTTPAVECDPEPEPEL